MYRGFSSAVCRVHIGERSTEWSRIVFSRSLPSRSGRSIDGARSRARGWSRYDAVGSERAGATGKCRHLAAIGDGRVTCPRQPQHKNSCGQHRWDVGRVAGSEGRAFPASFWRVLCNQKSSQKTSVRNPSIYRRTRHQVLAAIPSCHAHCLSHHIHFAVQLFRNTLIVLYKM